MVRNLMGRAASLCLAGTALLGGCHAVPPCSAPAREGVVLAHTLEVAERFARRIDEDLPRLRADLPGLESRRFEVWIEPTPTWLGFDVPKGIEGYANDRAGRVHVRHSPHDDEQTRQVLLHELVHLLEDAVWEALPGIAGEGLATYAPERIGAAVPRHERLMSLASGLGPLSGELDLPIDKGFSVRVPVEIQSLLAGGKPGALLDDGRIELRRRRWLHFDQAHYGAGYLIVRRIVERVGYVGLRNLCEEALLEGLDEVPLSRLLQAAELDESAESWRGAISEAWTPSPAWLEGDGQTEILAQAVATALTRFGGTPEGYLDRFEPVLRLSWPPCEVNLSALPGFSEAFARALSPDGRGS